MDPDAVLRRLRAAVADYHQPYDGHSLTPAQLLDELAEAFDLLDGWLTSGGFLPDDWGKNRVDPEVAALARDLLNP